MKTIKQWEALLRKEVKKFGGAFCDDKDPKRRLAAMLNLGGEPGFVCIEKNYRDPITLQAFRVHYLLSQQNISAKINLISRI